jgi:hypothetical protein
MQQAELHRFWYVRSLLKGQDKHGNSQTTRALKEKHERMSRRQERYWGLGVELCRKISHVIYVKKKSKEIIIQS